MVFSPTQKVEFLTHVFPEGHCPSAEMNLVHFMSMQDKFSIMNDIFFKYAQIYENDKIAANYTIFTRRLSLYEINSKDDLNAIMKTTHQANICLGLVDLCYQFEGQSIEESDQNFVHAISSRIERYREALNLIGNDEKNSSFHYLKSHLETEKILDVSYGISKLRCHDPEDFLSRIEFTIHQAFKTLKILEDLDEFFWKSINAAAILTSKNLVTQKLCTSLMHRKHDSDEGVTRDRPPLTSETIADLWARGTRAARDL